MLSGLLVVAVLAQADAIPAAQLRTARRLEFWVSPEGSDGRSCRTPARACRTPGAVFKRIPYQVDHQVVVNVLGLPDGGIGVYDAGVGYLQGHFFGAADPDNPGQVIIRCAQRPAVLDGGAAGGTFSAVTNGSGATWASYTDGTQTWVPSAMVDGGTVVGGAMGNGYWLALTAGPGSDGGMRLPIYDNTATVLQVPGQFPVAPSTATTYQVEEPAVMFTGSAGVVQLPGSLTGGSLRATFQAQLVLRNNVAGYAVSITSGSPDGGSWSPVMVQGCHFRADPAAQMAGVALDGPVAVLESRFDGFGANGRGILPISSRAELVVARNSWDMSSGGRVASFTRMGTEWTGCTVEQNVVITADYVVFGTGFPNGFLSHNNLFQRISTTGGGGAVYRVLETQDGYSFGDRVQHAPVFIRYPGGSLEQLGGRGQFWIDGITAGDINGPNGFASLAGRGGLFVGVGGGNGAYGVAPSFINIGVGARLATLNGPGTAFYWRHSNTTIVQDPAAVMDSAISTNDYVAGHSLQWVDSATPHEACTLRGACFGWLDDAALPFEAVVGFTGTGGGAVPIAVEPFSGTTSGGGTLTVNFSPVFQDKATCFASYEGDPGGGAPVPWAATTDGGVVWTAAASKALRGYCVGPR